MESSPAPVAATCTATATSFIGFRASRFDFSGGAHRYQTLREWLLRLPVVDPKRRFGAGSLRQLLDRMEAKMVKLTQHGDWYQPQSVLSRVVTAKLRKHEDLPDTLRDDIQQFAPIPLSDEHTLALLLYSAELYDVAGKPCRFQLYSELNRICREYGHADDIGAELRADWELFKPFAAHLQAAVLALPPVPMMLYRGAGYSINADAFPCNIRGSWGGFVSASSDRRQAVGFLNRDTGLHATKGSYFLILSDQARPLYHLSEFPEEMEYLHPLDLELETCMIIPAFMLVLAAVKVNVVVLKRAGAEVSLDLHLRLMASLSFIFEDMYSLYVMPGAKQHEADEPVALDERIEAFLQSSDHTLLVTGPQGIGKSLFTLWLAFHTEYKGWLFLYTCVARQSNPLAPNAIIETLRLQFGLHNGALAELRRRPLVLIMDNFFAEPLGPTLHEANGFADWNVKLIIVCRQEKLAQFRRWAGPNTTQMVFQPFNEEQIEEFVHRRLATPERPVSRDKSDSGRMGHKPDARRVSSISSGPSGGSLLQQLRNSPLWPQFTVPYALGMATELYVAGHHRLSGVTTWLRLHTAWLEWYLQMRGSDDVPGDMVKAEGVAWELQQNLGGYSLVGDRGNRDWFRRLPLLVVSYDPDGLFCIALHAIKDVLVALYLWRQLSTGTPDALAELGKATIKGEVSILRFFADIYHLPENAPFQSVVHQLLLTCSHTGEVSGVGDGRPESLPLTANAIALFECLTGDRSTP